MRYLLITLIRDLSVDALRPAPSGTDPETLLARRSPTGVFVPFKSPSRMASHFFRRFSSASRLAAGPSKNWLCHLHLKRAGRSRAASMNWSTACFVVFAL